MGSVCLIAEECSSAILVVLDSSTFGPGIKPGEYLCWALIWLGVTTFTRCVRDGQDKARGAELSSKSPCWAILVTTACQMLNNVVWTLASPPFDILSSARSLPQLAVCVLVIRHSCAVLPNHEILPASSRSRCGEDVIRSRSVYPILHRTHRIRAHGHSVGLLSFPTITELGLVGQKNPSSFQDLSFPGGASNVDQHEEAGQIPDV